MQEQWQSTKMWILQGRASTRQELSCMWGRRLVSLNGPCAAQKNVGGGADSGLRAPPLAFFDAHVCVFTILDVFEILFCGAGHFYSCAQAVSTTTLFRFFTDHIVVLRSLPRYRLFMLAYSHRAFSCLISCTVLVAFLYSVSDVCIRKHSRT